MDVSTIRKRKELMKSSSQLRWSSKTREMVAKYINVNIGTYNEIGSQGGSKINFLRKMRRDLRLNCTDIQLKNSFAGLMRKYRSVRDKLRSMGIDLKSEDLALQNWVLDECPYFNILEDVLGDKANGEPTCELNITTFGPTGDNSFISSEQENSMDIAFENDYPVSPNATNITTTDEEFENYEDNDAKPSTSKILKPGPVCIDEIKKTQKLVQSVMSALGDKLKKDAPVTSLSAFAAIVRNNSENMKEVETNKLNLEKEKFNFAKELAFEKLQHKAAKLEHALKTKEMEHHFELEKIKARGEIEVQKLQLQVELEKLRAEKEL